MGLLGTKEITFDRFIRLLIGTTSFIAVFLLFNRLSTVLLPFLVAWVIAYFLYPLVALFQYKLRLKFRILSILGALISVALLLIGLFYLLSPSIMEEFEKTRLLVSNSSHLTQANSTIPELFSSFLLNYIDLKQLENLLTQDDLVSALQIVIPQIWDLIKSSFNVLLSLGTSLIIMLYVFFILLDYEALRIGWIKFLPAKHRPFTVNLVEDLQEGMSRYFRGQGLVALLVAILFGVGFWIINFPLAICMALFIGLLTLIPYLKVLALIPAVLLSILKAAETNENFWVILFSVLVVFAIVQLIEDLFIVPKIMGKVTGLHPAIILLSLSVWGSLLGIPGILIALPITTLMISYYKRLVLKEEELVPFLPTVEPESEDETV